MAGLEVSVDLTTGKDMAFAALKIVQLYVNNSGDNVCIDKQPNGTLQFEFESDKAAAIANSAEVKRGEWKPVSPDPADPYFICTNCHMGYNTIYHECEEMKYCPNCGAKMEG